MNMIKIEFPAENRAAAMAFSVALAAIAAAGKTLEKPFSYGGKGTSSTACDDQFIVDPNPEPESPVSGEVTDDIPRDTRGVPFDAKYCSQAKEPFYANGVRAGQWKKRKGVSDASYDAWYAGELPSGHGDAEPAPVDTASAFAAAAPPPAETAAPKDVGSLMGWISEKQATGALTQEQINTSWAEAGIEMADLFNKTPDEIAANIARVFSILVIKAGA